MVMRRSLRRFKAQRRLHWRKEWNRIFFDKIHEIDLKKTMEKSYIDYAMSVIASRALPDVRDGLKPVQRRVLYSMAELNNGPDKPHRKKCPYRR